jgi:hypothetical protein
MDLHSLGADGDIGGSMIYPTTRIEVADALLLDHESGMCVTAKDSVDVAGPRIGHRSLCNLFGKAEPSGAGPVNVSRDDFVLAVDLLELIKQELSDTADEQVPAEEAVKLVPVNCQMSLAVELPDILLVNRDAYQVRHYVGKAQIVVSLHPHDLGAALWIRKPAYDGEKAPMVSGEPAEIQIGENVAQQNELAVMDGFKKVQSVRRPAHLRSEVEV